jgi:formate hydrogenlyase transcriptional activator
MPAASTLPTFVEEDRYLALIQATNAIATGEDCAAVSEALVTKLRDVTSFDSLHVVAFDAEARSACWSLLEAHGQRLSTPPDEALFHSGSPIEYIRDGGGPLITLDWKAETRFQSYGRLMSEVGISSTCMFPLIRGQRKLGVLAFGRFYPNAYDEHEVCFLNMVAGQLAMAVDASAQFWASRRARDQLKLILDLTNQVVSNLNFDNLLLAASRSVRQVMRCEAAAIMLADPERRHFRVHALDFPESRGVFTEGALIPIDGSQMGDSFRNRTPLVINSLDADNVSPEWRKKATAEGLNSFCDLPLVSRDRLLGILAVARRDENAFGPDEVAFLTQVASQVAIGVENALAYREIADLKDRLAQEKLYLESEIRDDRNFEGFEGIVGESPTLRHVLNMVETVAPRDSTVLLLGETGTGKELIARAIHERSRRRERTLVKLNCAAIPSGLLESELFGHERGAFTGAIAQRIGRLELADQGTLFLDEVGDIPIEIQPKLLRALQEREFERLGSARTLSVNVRLIAATNRDLEKMVENREFRSDLYYRLNVFPIRIPPLRERPEDIPLLVRYFTHRYARSMDKQIESIPSAAMKKLCAWHWPGNIRELENFIERSVILTQGPALEVPTAELGGGTTVSVVVPGSREMGRDAIVRVLKETNGRVSGPYGAATRLGIKRTTLISRMKKLGINLHGVS